jgi:hypothetical protein
VLHELDAHRLLSPHPFAQIASHSRG